MALDYFPNRCMYSFTVYHAFLRSFFNYSIMQGFTCPLNPTMKILSARKREKKKKKKRGEVFKKITHKLRISQLYVICLLKWAQHFKLYS